MYIYEEKANRKLVVGNVVSIKDIIVAGEARKAVKVIDRNDEVITLFAKDTVMARMEKAKLHEGSFVTILAFVDTEKKAGTALDFQFKGEWVFKDAERGTSVLIGTACKGEKKDDRFNCRMAVDQRDGTTKWASITFFNGKKGNNADFAEKLLGHGNRFCAIRTGLETKKVVGENTYHNYVGYAIELRPDKQEPAE